MAYATQDDLVPLRLSQKELIQLTDDDNTGAVNTNIVTAALSEASGRVESFCRQRYQTPLQASEDVKGLTLDIAIYLLFTRKRTGLQPNQIIRDRFEDALDFLSKIASGKASLDQPQNATAPQSASGNTIATSIPQAF